VTFRRLSYRALLGMPTPEPVETERVERDYGHGDRGGRRRRRRGGRGRGDHGAPRPVQHVPQQQPPPRPVVISGPEPHTAPHDEIVAVVRDLARSRGTVTLDSLANALKARGFSRPPGSPRLITRLRRIKELEVNRAGVITLVDGTAAPVTPAVESEEHGEIVADAFEPITADAEEAPVPSSPPERSEEIAEVAVDAEAEAPDPRNREGAHLQTAVGGDGGRRHRRSRRGGRRRRGRGGDGREGGGRDGGGGRPGGGGGGAPPRDGGSGPRSSGADRARDVASRYAPRDVAPSWISGQPLA
jgi:uncharacterized membrane protein YgcG